LGQDAKRVGMFVVKGVVRGAYEFVNPEHVGTDLI
jgi:hypothetical protein